MEPGSGSRSARRSRTEKADIGSVLRKSWFRLRLSVRHPTRVPTWDAVVLTASSPQQAELYNWQLNRAKRLGHIATSTVTLAVPDPEGQRIGSGAATLNAIDALARHYEELGTDPGTPGIHDPVANESKSDSGSSMTPKCYQNKVPLLQMVKCMTKRHILLLHAGGDSKRVPWANPMGKVFLPLSYLASDDPDSPVPLLFEHILAVSSCARQAFKNEGGLFIMTGDVLPCFDASMMVLPDDASCIVTVPTTLDIASNHGVIVAARRGIINECCSISLVDNLLQKPNLEELLESHAILDDGRTLLDTGIIAVRGKAWFELIMLSCSSHRMILELLRSNKEMSLYEDLVSAWVPAKHQWLQLRPLGEALISRLGRENLFSYCANDLLFLHFGTSSEVLDHLCGTDSGLVGRRHLCSLPATAVSDIAASAIVLSSKIAPGVSIGEESIVYDSSISSGIQIGSQSIVAGIKFPGEYNGATEGLCKLMLPDRHCLWEVPLVCSTEHVIVYCGLHDNPKDSLFGGGTFCGKPWEKVLLDLSIQEDDLWNPTVKEKCLWNAKIFPILPFFEMLNIGTWMMMGSCGHGVESFLPLWKKAQRVSLEELHRLIDFQRMCTASSNHQADLAAGIAKACINYGSLGHNLSQLCGEIMQKEMSGFDICKDLLDKCCRLQGQSCMILPKSRTYQVQVDLLRACGDEASACELQHKVWSSVADETASAIRHGFNENVRKPSTDMHASACFGNSIKEYADQGSCFRKTKVELPVRVDFAGGWSDTPPWSLERAGCVLNMAISLEGFLPIGTEIETRVITGLLMTDDAENQLFIDSPTSIEAPFSSDDPFRLVKSALLVTNIVHSRLIQSAGLKIRTWANVPRGSGLGSSSILAAAVVKGLLQIADGDDCNENVARLVLVLEQLMGTGGGWQDQIGGLYPGIKFTSSFPGIPLRLQVIPLLTSPRLIIELQQRLLVVFTGQVRLANEVLQKVVTRYLRRDNLLVSSIKRLTKLAKMGREALMNGNVDEVGEIMLEGWRLHQELDPGCSNEYVDRVFGVADEYCCGYKLVGAGGGGFALLLANDAGSAAELRRVLEGNPELDVRVYDWEIAF